MEAKLCLTAIFPKACAQR